MSRDDTNIDWQLLGQQFRQHREAAGIPVATVAGQLCLANSQILALETGSATNFPGTPARLWCARRYATLLGLDFISITAFDAASDTPTEAQGPAPSVLDNTLSDSENLSRTPASSMGKARWLVVLLFFALIALLSIQAYHPSSPTPVQPKQAVTPELPPPATPVAEPAPAPVVIPAAPIEAPQPEPLRKLVDVYGLDAQKPARSIYVMANEAVVLIKQREGQEAETLTLAQGAAQRISLANNEYLRVAEGKNLEIFFQGRKVSANTIASGNWLRFVPLRESASP